jgi:hypothetical protein
METLNVVYRYQNTSLSNDLVEFLFAYSEDELIKDSDVSEEATNNLIFDHKDDFEGFVNELTTKYKKSKALLVTADDYNLGLSNISNINEVDSIFEKYGTVLEKFEDSTSDKGFFGKFFK